MRSFGLSSDVLKGAGLACLMMGMMSILLRTAFPRPFLDGFLGSWVCIDFQRDFFLR